MLDVKNEIEEGGENHLLTQLYGHKLSCCQFLESLVHQCESVVVDRNVEIVDSILLHEQQLQALELAISLFQANE